MKSVSHYPFSVALLHWLLAVALIGNIIIGWMLDDHEDLLALHKSIGILILALVAVRLANRRRVRNILPRSINALETAAHFAEKAVHGMLYMLMTAIPLLGWMKTNAAGHTASFFGFISLPTLVPMNRELSHWLGELHALSAYGLAALVGLHVLGVLAHWAFKSENLLPRILSFRRPAARQRAPFLDR
ncbi:cytochrome b [Caballeronia glebae]|uniref:cytochrome b n=1 Tax=Caballeronia glebae TaxID=1777143 RepID=UPI0038B7D9AA